MSTKNYLKGFLGGSLAEIVPFPDRILKKYNGTISRGTEKIINEYKWLELLPAELKGTSLIFPDVLSFSQNVEMSNAELYISRIPRYTLAKSILQQVISTKDVRERLDKALNVLFHQIYTLRQGQISPQSGFVHFHRDRINLALKHLLTLDYFREIFDAHTVIVNSTPCPTIPEFLSWLDEKKDKIFTTQNLYSIHGNLQFDNILIEPNDKSAVSFIDPRGDMLGFPHYDFAKLLTSIESYYHEIHNGLFQLQSIMSSTQYVIDLSIDQSFSFYYSECFDVMNDWLPIYANLEGAEIFDYIHIINVVHCIHILSFCFYHAFRAEKHPDNIKAYIGVFSLLARRIMKDFENVHKATFYTRRLLLNE